MPVGRWRTVKIGSQTMRFLQFGLALWLATLAVTSSAEETNRFRQRQQRLFELAGVDAYVVHAVDPADPDDPYTENPDFFYLTGRKEPAAVLVVANASFHGHKSRTSTLFVRRWTAEAEKWQGIVTGYTGDAERDAAQASAAGVDRLEPLDRLNKVAAHWLRDTDRLAVPVPEVDLDHPLPASLAWLTKVRERFPMVTIVDLARSLAELRMRKDADEIAAIEKAVAVTVEAQHQAARAIRPDRNEGEIDAVILARYRARGARPSFASIVGSGPRTTTLHYSANDQAMPAGSLVVVDIGAEVDGYAADLTRTYPVSGKFSPRQREIYEVVLRARAAAIAAAGPGKSIQDDIDAAARKVIADAGFASAFWHRTSHYLGIEVHDAGDYSQPLAAGTVFTIEPGIYLPEEGIGVRIEDDVVVTDTGVRLLSAALPVEPAAIERWMAEGR